MEIKKFIFKLKIFNKKGFFFTILALLLIILLLSTIAIIHQNLAINSDSIEGVRVNSMNSFLDDVERDMNRAIYISSFRSVSSLINYITSNGIFIDDFNKRFSEAFYNGTIYTIPSTLLVNSTFNDWVLRVKKIADSYAINLSINPQSLKVTQSNPWSLTVDITVLLDAKDKSGIANWRYNLSENTSVSILGFEDPLYAIASQGRLFNIINKTPYQSFVEGNDTYNLKEHILHSYYINSSLAPDFIMRLTGNFSASPNGIESIFYLPDFSAQGLQTYDKSAIDYVYMSNTSPTIYVINGTFESWFRMDSDHLDLYGVENLTK